MGSLARIVTAALAGLLLAAAPAAAASPAQAAFDAAIADTKAAMMADPQRALAKADVAMTRAAALPPGREADLARAAAQWLKAEAHLYAGTDGLKQARALVGPALATAERHAPRGKLHGDLMRTTGAISAQAGNMQEALRAYLAAFQIFRAAGEIRSQAIALQDVGQIYSDAGDSERALRYYAQANELYTADPAFTLTARNNRGDELRKLGRLAEAEREFLAALALARKLGSPLLEVRIVSNLAWLQVELGNLPAATANSRRAMRLARAGEAAGWLPFIYGVAAKIAVARGQWSDASRLVDLTFAGADLGKTELAMKEVHALAAQVFERSGDERKALQHLKAFQRLDSEARNLTSSTSSQLMSARFDFANQNLRISKLKQGRLELDVQLERQRGRLQSLALAAVAIIAGLLAIGFVSLRRSRNETRAANTVLSEVNVRLEGALKAKTDFLATTSHEIRTPLNGILGMTQILLTNRKLPPETREQIEVVHGAGETMRALVDDILDVAKMETGELQVASEPTRPRVILEETERLWRGQAEAKGLALSLAIDGVPDAILSDPTRLRQVIFNLVSNAIKFTPAGSVAITAAARDEALTIAVTDTGVGIPADQLDLIFDPFHQVDGGTTRQFSGTGLGLAICRKIVDALGGRIAVESEVGRGSTFRVTLPLIAANEPTAAIAERAERSHGLLLVESNPLTQGVFRNLLEPIFPAPRCVDDGEAAMAAIDAGGETQLVIEARSAAMPGLDALASLRRLVEHGRAGGMHVTVLLAPGDDLPIELVLALDADQVVLKPVSGAQLLRKLDLRQQDTPPARAAA